VSHLAGLDLGYFAHSLVGPTALPEHVLDVQWFKDVRTVSERDVADYDIVVYLAAISNDPMGKAYEEQTLDINWKAAVRLAKLAKSARCRNFVFASSCSVYGYAENGVADETSPTNPLTAYARSKLHAEQELEPLADDTFTISCLRFATACGPSERLRLDLVLNDFVASALATGRVSILSDGTPWRPLIHVDDMGRAIAWAAERPRENGGSFLVVNVGAQEGNYQVSQLAHAVARALPGTAVHINPDAPKDLRSYRVSFDRFTKLAPNAQPKHTLDDAVNGLLECLRGAKFADETFRSSSLMRLNVLSDFRKSGQLDADLRWIR
jgi:nucleoside-diphosphate-sugar epimerase